MRCLIQVCFCLLCFLDWLNGQTASLSTSSSMSSEKTEQEESDQHAQHCPNIVFVESPWRDTYTSVMKDSVVFGEEVMMKVRGEPTKKSMHALVSFYTPKVDLAHIKKCYLKIYTISRRNEGALMLYNLSEAIDEENTNWHNQPEADQFITKQSIVDDFAMEFEITEFVRRNLSKGILRFRIQSDGKKPVEIASRESGLGAELILDLCPPVEQDHLMRAKERTAEEYSFRVFPCPTSGKFTLELIGVPVGGFGECMLMNEAGAIVRKYPLAIRQGEILYHSLDLGDLIPGSYWAVFRKGRIVLRDQFRLIPSKEFDRMLEVASN